MMLFKSFGVILFISACTGYGFFLAGKIECRTTALGEICNAINELKERIYHNDGEIRQLLKLTFSGCRAIEISNEKVNINTSILNKDDEKILRDFFSVVGNQDMENEYSRCEMYFKLINSSYHAALTEQNQKSKILRTTGICAGIAGAIFLI